MSDIFLSYAREDEARVRPLVEHFERLGWSVFWDRNIPPGLEWEDKIEEQLEKAKCVVVIWSKYSTESKWVRIEAGEGQDRDILVPVFFDNVKLRLRFKRLQAADLTAWKNDVDHEEFRACVDRIASFVSKRAHINSQPIVPSAALALWKSQQPQLPENFVLIRGDQFTMGSPEGEDGRDSSERQHEVKLSDFVICKFPVTVAEYREFCTDIGKTYEVDRKPRLPAVNVSWKDAVDYCDWLSKRRGGSYRLPTEAQWEYACRAGTTTPFSFGENLTTDQANYDGRYPYRDYRQGVYRQKILPVYLLEANSFGLYNMHGNIWEWCGDWYDKDYYEVCRRQNVVENPQGPVSGSYRAVRGGAWTSMAQGCRSACRTGESPFYDSGRLGFRLVFVQQL